MSHLLLQNKQMALPESKFSGVTHDGISSNAPRLRVLHWIGTAIEDGRLSPGDPIPSERALATKLGVARNTAAAAIDEAERRGIVVRRSPNAHKRFVPEASAVVSPLAASTIYVLGDMDPFPEMLPPRWSDRLIMTSLPVALLHAGKHVMTLNHSALTASDIDDLFLSPPAGMVLTASVGGHPLAMHALRKCRATSTPVVVYGNAPEFREFDRVYTDQRAGGRELTEWLIARGCRRIVPFFPEEPDTHWARERIAGYREAMEAAGLVAEPCQGFYYTRELSGLSIDKQFRLMEAMALKSLVRLLRTAKVDALVCISDHLAKPVIAALRDLGLETDVLVAGYDNGNPDPIFDPFEKALPTVTVDKHNEKTAEELADLLSRRMSGELPPEPQCVSHPHELVVREDLATDQPLDKEKTLKS